MRIARRCTSDPSSESVRLFEKQTECRRQCTAQSRVNSFSAQEFSPGVRAALTLRYRRGSEVIPMSRGSNAVALMERTLPLALRQMHESHTRDEVLETLGEILVDFVG